MRAWRTKAVPAVVLGTALAAGCGGPSEGDRAADAVDTYFSAAARRDARAVCAIFTRAYRAKADRRQKQEGDEGGCVGLFTEAWKTRRSVVLTGRKVLGTRIAGDRARVAVQGTAHRILQRTTFSLVREDGDWHVEGSSAPTTPDGRRVFTVPTEGMSPSLHINDQFVLDAHAYDTAAPRIGDVVVFHPPRGVEGGAAQCAGRPDALGIPERLCVRPSAPQGEESYIKRIVAGPGDRIAFRKGHAIVDGRQADEPYVSPSSCAGENAVGCDYPRAITVPEGRYYLVGDNRGNSDDSRFWGAVPKAWIMGRVR